jgi:hypothetical protein
MTPEITALPTEALPRPGISEPYASIVDVTPEIAREWWKRRRSMNRTMKNRNISQYGRDQLAGNWRLNNDAICFDTDGFLQNGHHRLRACIDKQTTFRTFVHWNVPVDSFITMDVHGKRTMADTLILSGESATKAKILGPGLIWYWRFLNQSMLAHDSAISYDEQKQVYEAHKAQLDAAAEFVAGLKIQTVIAPPLAFFGAAVLRQQDSAKAEIFFTQLATGATGSDPDAPILLFRNALLKSRQSRQFRLSQIQMVVLMFRVWEIFIANKPAKLLKAPTDAETKKAMKKIPLFYGAPLGTMA